jgi:glycosyltransferase involved in cell wall biosynthesis
MISFITIGRNIEKTIEICIESILEFIRVNLIINSEIIYVDSESNDRTIEFAQKYPIQIIKISGKINAAIGRNEGVRHAKGNILFFIDGDMEIFPDFFNVAFKNENELCYPFCTGIFSNRYYDSNFKFLNEEVYIKSNEKAKFSTITGGLFIIEKYIWNELDGMDSRFDRNEDLDFGIRMTNRMQPLLIYNNLLATHHTIDYFERGRIKSFIFSRYLIFYGILIRKHIFSYDFIKLLIRGRYSMFILIASLFTHYILLFYFLVQILRTLKNHKRDKAFVNSLLYKLLADVYCIVGILFFYPRPKKYESEILKVV